jgi:glutaminyl-peptide cyclotransferase
MRRMAGGIALVVLAALVVGVFVMRPWNGNAEPPRKIADTFASDREVPPEPAAFDGKRAMGYLEALCKIGPRISGTDGMKKQQDMLEKHFKDRGAQIEWQRFTATQRSTRQDVAMANLIASWHPERERRVILCSHYDTRPHADEEHDAAHWRQPFLSANDGGSGVALLMELAHHMKDLKLKVGVDFVLFDGEEYVFDKDDKYFFGSEHFGREYRRARGKKFYGGAVLLDMVGGKKARFRREPHSWEMAPGFVEAIWALAADLKCTAFDANDFGARVQDDHLALNQSGIPAIDIIDFSYPHWHRVSDVPENCSGESLEQVARVLSVWMQLVK